MTALTDREDTLAKSDRMDHGEITPEIFSHLVELAALNLDDEESEYLRGELNAQLKAIRELEGIKLSPDIPITSHGVPYTHSISALLREDTIRPSPQADEIVSGAPETDLRYFVVPDIPHEELE